MHINVHCFRALIILMLGFLTFGAMAQVPVNISYQAVVRDLNGHLMTDRKVTLRVQILQGSEFGAVKFVEAHTPTTNANGLMSAVIGAGDPVHGDLATIDWSDGPYFIKTEVDPKGGSDYCIIGLSQILSVPYALHARSAETVKEVDPQFHAWNKSYNDLIDKPSLQDSIRQNAVMLTGDQFVNGKKTFPDGIVGAVDANKARISNVADPVHATDATNKAYVDQLLAELDDLRVAAGLKVTDVDGNVYRAVRIGSQTWMAENLRTTRFNDGSPIAHIRDSVAWIFANSPGYCWYQNDSATHFDKKFGPLYNWYAVRPSANSTKNVCPLGWHVPTSEEMTIFRDYINNNGLINKIVETGTSNWNVRTSRATDELRFTALPAGTRGTLSTGFTRKGTATLWWSSTSSVITRPYLSLELVADRWELSMGGADPKMGLSIRCIRD